MAASFTVQGDVFVPAKPRVWSETRLVNTGAVGNFALAPGGKRFAALMPADEPESAETRSHLTLMLNFGDELRRRLP